jgi:hypothetical protein
MKNPKAGETPALSDSSNEFEVVRGGETIRILQPPLRPMTVTESLRLAAWIVALADPQRKNFERILVEVLSK